MPDNSNGTLIRTLRQISRDKNVSPEVRVRCCELLVLIDPSISFNSFEKPTLSHFDLPIASRTPLNTSPQLRKTPQSGGRDGEGEANRGADGWMDPLLDLAKRTVEISDEHEISTTEE